MAPKIPEIMQFRENRLETFENGAFQSKSKQKRYWTHEKPSPEVLADHGFYFTPTKINPDQITCYSCKKKETNVGGVENIAQHHLEANPECALSRIISKQVGHLSSEQSLEEFWRSSGVVFDSPISKEAVDLRKKTFGTFWKNENKKSKVTSLGLAQAGFYYCPIRYGNDRVQCVYCNCSLDTWLPEDFPVDEHRANASGFCYFLEALEKSEAQSLEGSSQKSAMGTKTKAAKVPAKRANNTRAKKAKKGEDQIDKILSTEDQANELEFNHNGDNDDEHPIDEDVHAEPPAETIFSDAKEAEENKDDLDMVETIQPPTRRGRRKGMQIQPDVKEKKVDKKESGVVKIAESRTRRSKRIASQEIKTTDDEDNQSFLKNATCKEDNEIIAPRRTRARTRRRKIEESLAEEEPSHVENESDMKMKVDVEEDLIKLNEEEDSSNGKGKEDSSIDFSFLEEEEIENIKDENNHELVEKDEHSQDDEMEIEADQEEDKINQHGKKIHDGIYQAEEKDDEEDDDEVNIEEVDEKEEEYKEEDVEVEVSEDIDEDDVEEDDDEEEEEEFEAEPMENVERSHRKTRSDNLKSIKAKEEPTIAKDPEPKPILRKISTQPKKRISSKPTLPNNIDFDDDRFQQILTSPKKSKKIRMKGGHKNSPTPPISYHDTSNQNLGDYEEGNIDFLEQNVILQPQNNKNSHDSPKKVDKFIQSLSTVLKPTSLTKLPSPEIVPTAKTKANGKASQKKSEPAGLFDTSSVFDKVDSNFDPTNIMISKPIKKELDIRQPIPKIKKYVEAVIDKKGESNVEEEREDDEVYVDATDNFLDGLKSSDEEEAEQHVNGRSTPEPEEKHYSRELGKKKGKLDDTTIEKEVSEDKEDEQEYEQDILKQEDVEKEDFEEGKEEDEEKESDKEEAVDYEIVDEEGVVDGAVSKMKNQEEKAEEADKDEEDHYEEEDDDMIIENQSMDSPSEHESLISTHQDKASSSTFLRKEEATGKLAQEDKIAELSSHPFSSNSIDHSSSKPNIETPSKRSYSTRHTEIEGGEEEGGESSKLRSSPQKFPETSPLAQNSTFVEIANENEKEPNEEMQFKRRKKLGEVELIESSTPQKKSTKEAPNKKGLGLPLSASSLAGWSRASFSKLLDHLNNMEITAEYLHSLTTSEYDLNDDYEGELTSFISSIPEHEEEMTLQQWIRSNAVNSRTLIEKYCSDMINTYRKECDRSIRALKGMPTVEDREEPK